MFGANSPQWCDRVPLFIFSSRQELELSTGIILNKKLVQSAFQQTQGDKFTFQQGNNLKHKAKYTLELLTKIPEWPSYSFDLNRARKYTAHILIKYFFLYIVECADNKITQKLSMEIKSINPWRSGFGVKIKKLKWLIHYRLIQLWCNVLKTSLNEAQ